MPQPLARMKGLKRYYEMASGTIKALDGVNLEVYEGDRVILLGPSGSGKTTLLNCLSALDTPTDGHYSFDGAPVPQGDSETMTTFRRENIGYVFQFFNLLQDLTVLENILLIQELVMVSAAVRDVLGLEHRVDLSVDGHVPVLAAVTLLCALLRNEGVDPGD